MTVPIIHFCFFALTSKSVFAFNFLGNQSKVIDVKKVSVVYFMYSWWRSWEQNVVTSWFEIIFVQIYLYILFTTYGNLKCQSNRPLKYPHFVTNFELKILLHFVLQTFLAEFWDQILPSSIFGGTECLLTFVAGF